MEVKVTLIIALNLLYSMKTMQTHLSAGGGCVQNSVTSFPHHTNYFRR